MNEGSAEITEMGVDLSPFEEPDIWCPMSGGNCRSNCAWADVTVEIDEDGIDRRIYCAVTLFVANALNVDEDGLEV